MFSIKEVIFVATTTQNTQVEPSVFDLKSTWRTKFQALGPGILMASAAIGGSHLIASTQAGAMFGWQLVLIIILANLFKYPFFRFAYEYTLSNKESLLAGYFSKNKAYVWAYFVLNVFSAVVNTAAILMLCAAIMGFILSPFLPSQLFVATPFAMSSITFLSLFILSVSLLFLLRGQYAVLDALCKWIMVALTLATVVAVLIALKNPVKPVAGFQPASPWNMASMAFIVALMGWMPAPIEISSITSMWLEAKNKVVKLSLKDSLFDFNVGYISTASLALVFLALGALIQYGSGEKIQMLGAAYIAQLIQMYAATIGEWSKMLISFIAFACIFGTLVTVLDGYSRTNAESVRLLTKNKIRFTTRMLNIWILATAIIGMLILVYFKGHLGKMLTFAMICSFVSTPVFAWLNLRLVNHANSRTAKWLIGLAWVGLFYLSAFALFFIFSHFF